MLDRRNILLGGGLLLGLGAYLAPKMDALGDPATGAPTGASAIRPALKAVFTLGGSQYLFDAAAGEDMGSYVGEFVRQRCVRVIRPELPFTVFFRPDLEGDRAEVVVELGRMWMPRGSPALRHISDPYTVEIFRGAQSIAKIEVPYHWWWARWRWQSAPRPVVRKVSELISAKLIPSYGTGNIISTAPSVGLQTYLRPMDKCGMLFDGSTGERGEIGPVTEPQAEWIINGNDTAFRTMMAQAEACASAPIHWRDENTGALIDFQKFKTASINPFSGNPVIPNPPKPVTSTGSDDPRYMHAETSHTPSLVYLPYLLTDDPYHLEEMQALGTLAIGFTGWDRGKNKLPGLVTVNQTRGFAWSMRALFELGVAQPDKLPSWFLSKQYWKKCIADNRAYMQLFIDSPARVHKYFRQFPDVGSIAPWQNCFISFILGWGIEMGYVEWKDAYEWHLPGVLAFCNGKSGWNRQFPTPYFWHALDFWPAQDEHGLVHDTSLDAHTLPDWSAAWAFHKLHFNIDDAMWDGHTIMDKSSGPAYLFYLLGALQMAVKNGHLEAREPLAWLEAEIPLMPYNRNAAGVKGFAKWSLASS